VTNGWIPALSGPDGPTGVLEDAPLPAIAQSLIAFASASTMPAAVTQQLHRAAESATAAAAADSTTAYGHLGAAYAYVIQAHRAASDDPTT
jgi:hypothetical protein